MLSITTPEQRALRSILSESLPPKVMKLVESYVLEFSEATEVLTLGSDGKPLDSELNRTTIASMKLALTSPQCDRGFIRQIFENAVDNGYKAFLNDVLDELRAQNTPITLNYVDFLGMDLSGLHFDSASMTNAKFSGTRLSEASFVGADLTNATGLTRATGQIFLNCLTNLTNTGLHYNSEKLNALLGTHSCLIALSENDQRTNHLTIEFDNTTYLIPYRFATVDNDAPVINIE